MSRLRSCAVYGRLPVPTVWRFRTVKSWGDLAAIFFRRVGRLYRLAEPALWSVRSWWDPPHRKKSRVVGYESECFKIGSGIGFNPFVSLVKIVYVVCIDAAVYSSVITVGVCCFDFTDRGCCVRAHPQKLSHGNKLREYFHKVSHRWALMFNKIVNSTKIHVVMLSCAGYLPALWANEMMFVLILSILNLLTPISPTFSGLNFLHFLLRILHEKQFVCSVRRNFITFVAFWPFWAVFHFAAFRGWSFEVKIVSWRL